MRHRRNLAAGVLIGVVTAAMASSGCGVSKKPETDVRLVWPAPPLETRIKFVRSIVGEDDVSRDTTFSQKVLNLLSGVTPPANRIVEPMGLARS